MKTYTNSSTNLHTQESMWRVAIQDAETEISRAKGKIARLRESIRVFRKKIENGEAWPDESSTQT